MPAFDLSPGSQTAAPNVFAAILLTMDPPVGSLQSFAFDDGGGGGSFSYGSPMVVGVFAASKGLSYKNTTPGTYTITFTPGAGPLNGQPAQSVTVTVSAATGSRHPRLISVRNNGLSLS